MTGRPIALALAITALASPVAWCVCQDAPLSYEQAVALAPAAQKQALVVLAASGSLDAAARMIELQMVDEVAQLDPQSPSIEAWEQSDRTIDGMTAPQIHAVVSMYWIARASPPDADVRRSRALGILVPAGPACPFIDNALLELTPVGAEVDPAWSHEQRAKVARSFEAFAVHADLLVRGACLMAAAKCLRPEKDTAGDWSKPAELYARAADALTEAGDGAGAGHALHLQGWSLQPDHDPYGDWTRAAVVYGRAVVLREAAGDLEGAGASLFGQACCIEPCHNPSGNWSQAAELFGRSAQFKERAGDLAGCGKSLYEQGWCLEPNHGTTDGDWDHAAAVFARSAALREQAVDLTGCGNSLEEQAVCVLHGGLDRSQAAEARELLLKAREVFTRTRDAKRLASVDKWIAWIDKS